MQGIQEYGQHLKKQNYDFLRKSHFFRITEVNTLEWTKIQKSAIYGSRTVCLKG